MWPTFACFTALAISSYFVTHATSITIVTTFFLAKIPEIPYRANVAPSTINITRRIPSARFLTAFLAFYIIPSIFTSITFVPILCTLLTVIRTVFETCISHITYFTVITSSSNPVTDIIFTIIGTRLVTINTVCFFYTAQTLASNPITDVTFTIIGTRFVTINTVFSFCTIPTNACSITITVTITKAVFVTKVTIFSWYT